MLIHSLKLQNFRSYKKVDVNLDQNTIFIGQNAQGKTNLLEAVYVCSVGKSYRAKERDLVLWGEDFFRIESEIEGGKEKKVELIYEKNIGKGRKTVKINGAKKASSALLDAVKCIFFSPEEIDMFFGFPSSRRRHFNVFISQTDGDYRRHLIKYSKVLDQRNSLLRLIREGLAKEKDLEVWDGKLAEHGSSIIKKRKQALQEINKNLAEDYGAIAGSTDTLKLGYLPSQKSGSKEEDAWGSFLQALLASRKKDVLSGVTNVGPHRDDFQFILNERSLVDFASRGEFRSAILALKMSEAKVLKSKTGTTPILLLDDVFSELDEQRRKCLAKNFSGQQTIVTTTDLDHIDKSLAKNASIYKIENGKLEKL